MARILRGDIVWADLDPARGHEQGGLRPVLVLSPDYFNDSSGTLIVMAITSRVQRAGFPMTYELPDILPQRSWVKISQVRTISTMRTGKRIGRLPASDLAEIVKGLLEIIE